MEQGLWMFYNFLYMYNEIQYNLYNLQLFLYKCRWKIHPIRSIGHEEISVFPMYVSKPFHLSFAINNDLDSTHTWYSYCLAFTIKIKFLYIAWAIQLKFLYRLSPQKNYNRTFSINIFQNCELI